MESHDLQIRKLERDLAAAQDPRVQVGLARAYARAGRIEDAARQLDLALRAEPLLPQALALETELGLSPLAHSSPWPTVAGGNDRARRSAFPGARRGDVARRVRVGAAAFQRGRGEVERPLSFTVGGDGVVYIATDQRRLIALDLESNEPRWTRELEHAFAAPSVGSGERLALASGDTVRLLSGVTGETLWIARAGGVTDELVPAQATFAPGGLVLAPGLRGALHAYDAATGKLRFSFATRGAQYCTPAVVGARIFHACSLGGVYSIGLDGRKLGDARVKECNVPAGVIAARADLVLIQRPVQGRLHSFAVTAEGALGPPAELSQSVRGVPAAREERTPRLLAASATEAVVDARPHVLRVALDGKRETPIAGPVSVHWEREAAVDSAGWVYLRTREAVSLHAPGGGAAKATVAVDAALPPLPSVAIGPGGTTLVGSSRGVLSVIR